MAHLVFYKNNCLLPFKGLYNSVLPFYRVVCNSTRTYLTVWELHVFDLGPSNRALIIGALKLCTSEYAYMCTVCVCKNGVFKAVFESTV